LYASDEPGYFKNLQIQVEAIKNKLIQSSERLTTTLLELRRCGFSHPATAVSTAKKARREKEKKRKKNTEKKEQRLDGKEPSNLLFDSHPKR